MGIYSIENLAHFDPNRLKKHLGIMGLQLYYHAWGLDASIIREKAPVKNRSYSKNQTLMRDYFSKAEILIIIKEHYFIIIVVGCFKITNIIILS